MGIQWVGSVVGKMLEAVGNRLARAGGSTARSGFVVLALLAGCAAPARIEPFQAGTAPGEMIHRHTGFVFPARIGSFARVTGHQYDAEGRDVSVGYNGDIPVVVTVYVYPAGPQSLEAALVQQSAAVLDAYPGAAVDLQRTLQVTPRAIEARAVTFRFSAEFFGKVQPLHSVLVLARHGASYVKYRVTYPADIADLAGEDSGNFLQHFSWPDSAN
jgi:hypothetical protein